MNSTTYHVLCSYVGSRLLRPHPWPVPAVLPFPLHFTTAVYVVVGDDGRCCYVGSVGRTVGGLAERIAEHLRDTAKRAMWQTVWVLPLRQDTDLLRSDGSRASSGRTSDPSPTDCGYPAHPMRLFGGHSPGSPRSGPHEDPPHRGKRPARRSPRRPADRPGGTSCWIPVLGAPKCGPLD